MKGKEVEKVLGAKQLILNYYYYLVNTAEDFLTSLFWTHHTLLAQVPEYANCNLFTGQEGKEHMHAVQTGKCC